MVIGATSMSSRETPSRKMLTTMSEAELAELTLTVAVAQGFSKAAIAWGPAPELPTMVIPTPGT